MRILAIRGERLASLFERFEIDFREAPLAGTGLYAITGQTGAGKSTILDAICLACYGDTPRVEGSGGPEVALGLAEGEEDQRLKAKDARNLLSRGSRSGWAEVEFRAQDGADYRTRWEVAPRPRARKLAEPEMHVVRLADQAVVATGLAASRQAVERLIGFTFPEFLKAVLLPQGQFAEFLRANAKDRADILEKVTGGQLYARLGQLADERQSREAEALQSLEAKAGAFQPLEDAERAARETERATAETEQAVARSRERAAREALTWHDDAGRLEEDLAGAVKATAVAGQAVSAALPRRAELALVEQARARQEPLDTARAAEGAVENARKAIEERRTQAQAAAQAAAAAAQALRETKVARQAIAEEQVRLKPELETARQLDAQVASAAEQAARDLKARQAAEGEASRTRRLAEAAGAKLQVLTTALAEGQRWFVTREAEAPVVAEWPRWREAIERHAAAAGKAAAARRTLEEAATPEAVAKARGEASEAALRRDEQAGVAARARAEATEAEGRVEGQAKLVEGARELEQAARAAQQLEGRRAELVPGKPCPLCGSTEHPWAGEGALDATVSKAETHRKSLERAHLESGAELKRLAEAAHGADRRAAEARKVAEERVRAATRLDEELQKAGRATLEAALAQAQEELRRLEAQLAIPFAGVPGWREALASGAAALRERWDGAASEHAAQRTRLDQATSGLAAAQAEVATAEAHGAAAAKAQEDAVRVHGAAAAALAARQAERARQLGGRPVAEVEHGLAARLADAERRMDLAAERSQGAEAAKAEAAGRLQEAEQRLQTATVEAGRALEALQALLRELAVDREVLEARVARGAPWVEEERRDLLAIDTAARKAATVVEERQRAKAQHEGQRPALDRTAAEQARDQAQAQATDADRRKLEAQVALSRDAEARAGLAELAPRLQAQRARSDLARRLADVIGGQGAKSFRIFAQGLALESLLGHANRHLEQLAPRYRLARIPNTDLDLQVIDQENGNGARGVNSLSGGETFLVSLGLALGLSSLASRSVRVESLFVDEGFGTLDPQTLDQAMAVLEGLQATGRTVGIITHVPELHERVGVAVEVEKLGAGKSRVRAVRVEG